MKLKIVLAAGLLLASCMTLAQQTDTQDQADPALQTEKPDKPKPLTLDPLREDPALVSPLYQADNNNPQLGVTLFNLNGGGPEREKRVSLDVTDMPVKQALQRLFDQVKLTFEAEKDVPEDAKVTLKLNNVRFVTALDALTESAGIGWQQQYTVKDNKANSIYKVGKKLNSPSIVYPWPNNLHWGNDVWSLNGKTFRQYNKPNQLNVTPFKTIVPKNAEPLTLDTVPNLIYNLHAQEDRHTFTCPHCAQQVTILSKREAPKCEKCGRTFQSGWKVCPFDGTKRPASPDTWQFCPHCGKRVTP